MISRIIILSALVFSAATSLGSPVIEHESNSRLKAIVSKYPKYSEKILAAPAKPVKSVPVQKGPIKRLESSRVVPKVRRGLLGLIDKAARFCGIRPEVLLAIQVHESAAYRSSLWKRAFNPGGIKYTHRVKCYKTGAYAGFNSAEEGIMAHAAILNHPRYDRARSTNDPYEQIRAIGDAGYCRPRGSWDSYVKKYYRKFSQQPPEFAGVD